jgi:Fe-S-cluster containining protein
VAFYLSTPHDRVDDLRTSMYDGEQIADMVIPLTVAEANTRLERFGSDREYGRDSEGYVYTCRNLDERTRLCKIYEERPQMCRDYPYARDGGCEYECDYCSPPDVVGKWELFNAEPRRACPPREPMSQR